MKNIAAIGAIMSLNAKLHHLKKSQEEHREALADGVTIEYAHNDETSFVMKIFLYLMTNIADDLNVLTELLVSPIVE